MQYTVRQIANPIDRSEVLWYAVPVWNGRMTIKEISKRIANGCTLTPVDIQAVLQAFLENLPEYLIMGYIMELGDLGSLRFSFKSRGHLHKEDVSPSDIKHTAVRFFASKELKTRIAQDLSYSFRSPAGTETQTAASTQTGLVE